MTQPRPIRFAEPDLDALALEEGAVGVLMTEDGSMDATVRRVNRATRGTLARLAEGPAWSDLKPGEGLAVPMPVGLKADVLVAVKLAKRPSADQARKAGASVAKLIGDKSLTMIAANPRAAEIAFGFALRAYRFDRKSKTEVTAPAAATVMVAKPEEVATATHDLAAVAEGVFFTRDLVNEPANILTTDDFAARLAAMQELGLEVEILDEEELETLGMRLLLAVGEGSASPSKVVVMRWAGADAPPLALVGKGVVFDTGGISIKPAQGMEEMTMDMGGAGIVAGVMRTLALRKARAHVVGLVGLVENMPSGTAARPGDIVTSMKGDTVEIINTDAEGRLVLADVLWYAQERFKPAGIVDLATLTGAMIVALGHERAGVFGNDDKFRDAFLKAAEAEGEGAWPMPLGPAYDALLKSRLADMKNIGGRWAGSITAAQFLQRFVEDGTPWIHIDVAGVALPPAETPLAPKGPTGWGVRSLDRLVRDRYETDN